MTAAQVLAHPLTQQWELPVSPLFLGAVALCVVMGTARVALRTPAPAAPPAPDLRPDQTDRGGAVFWITRAFGLTLFMAAVVAGRLGHPGELSNIAPALVIGAGWPLLVLAAVVAGRVWWWIDPFDTLARAIAPLGAGAGSAEDPDVRWSVPAAVAWTAYLTMWPNHLAPRSVAAALLTYLVVTLAGCLATGRRTWLSRAEIFGVFFGLIAAVRREGARVGLPRGADLVLAVLSGGFVYGLLRDSQLLADIGYGPRSTLYSAIALLVCVTAAGAAVHALQRHEVSSGVTGTAAVALVAAAAGLALALALARSRLTTSLQLLPILASDPLGTGVDLFGTRDWELVPRPLGVTGLLVAQICVLVASHVIGVMLAVRRVRTIAQGEPARMARPAVGLLAGLLAVSVAAVAATALT